jgi:hypothetical protein
MHSGAIVFGAEAQLDDGQRIELPIIRQLVIALEMLQGFG